jgi:hypothetical protein
MYMNVYSMLIITSCSFANTFYTKLIFSCCYIFVGAAKVCAAWLRVGVNYVFHLVLDNTWKQNGAKKIMNSWELCTSLTHWQWQFAGLN